MTIKEIMERVQYARGQAAYWTGRADAYSEMLKLATHEPDSDKTE